MIQEPRFTFQWRKYGPRLLCILKTLHFLFFSGLHIIDDTFNSVNVEWDDFLDQTQFDHYNIRLEKEGESDPQDFSSEIFSPASFTDFPDLEPATKYSIMVSVTSKDFGLGAWSDPAVIKTKPAKLTG